MTSSPSRRTVLGAALGVASAAALAGCSGGRPADGRTAVRFLGPETPETFRAVIRGFERANPDLRIDYTPVPPDQLGDVLQLRLSAKDSAIDVYTVDQPRVPALTARGFLTDLDAVADRTRPPSPPSSTASAPGRAGSVPCRSGPPPSTSSTTRTCSPRPVHRSPERPPRTAGAGSGPRA
ncbi:extracellular solute-binding protein [Streptomyces sp. Ncost-T10-10d]|uniref:extracellular solute-binding protein n=1 Tax=Streptomyces sp. Ncost-T10-10d TaxID=1839774 RepID=UPI000A592EE2|nr:extracellular solute-binding protein [Streptomyces sp. Ncost-T10-10d]